MGLAPGRLRRSDGGSADADPLNIPADWAAPHSAHRRPLAADFWPRR